MSLTKIQPSGIDSTKDYAVDQLTANTIVANGINLFTFANAAFTSANAAGSSSTVTAAFDTANSASSYANGSFLTANSAASYANAAFERANGPGGVVFTSSATTPASANVGDQWYSTSQNILYEYLDVGDSNTWVDITGPTVNSNTFIDAPSFNPLVFLTSGM